MFFLDFDGVLFDTVREAYAVATITDKKYNSINEIQFNTVHYKNFKKLRYLISPAWNYKYLLDELKSNNSLQIIRNNFINKIENASKSEYQDFENNFFETRNYLKKNHYESWFRLNIPFPFLHEIEILFYNYKDLVYIVTTKDKKSVLKLLSLEGIEFNENRIFDRKDYEIHGNKKNIIETLVDKNNENIFIDDSDRHINDCKKITKLKCFQPEWGYVSLNSQTSNQRLIINEINKLLEDREENV